MPFGVEDCNSNALALNVTLSPVMCCGRIALMFMTAGMAGLFAADADLDASIARNRTGTLVIRARPGAKIAVEQLRHGFWFGATLAVRAFYGKHRITVDGKEVVVSLSRTERVKLVDLE